MIFAVMLAFGDSLTFGARDELGKSWPQYLAEIHYDVYKQPLIYANEGVNGETIAEACRRAYPTLLKYPAASEVVFFEGTNDAKPGIRTRVVEYSKSLSYIVNVFRAHGRFLYLPTLPGLKGFGSQEYDSESEHRIQEYNKVIRLIGNQPGCSVVELAVPESDYVDGCHLDSFGYRKIAQKIFDEVRKRRTL